MASPVFMRWPLVFFEKSCEVAMAPKGNACRAVSAGTPLVFEEPKVHE
jgi:hypothetical protein